MKHRGFAGRDRGTLAQHGSNERVAVDDVASQVAAPMHVARANAVTK
jgi:hypothetical protein